ncbi:acetylornithine deacetylase [Oceanisphaera psychrotolerans]|uniref:Acetylornithine deacetylase (ArgE) n=1 Tax=Oceanisphaera psychrotolerans TaxID=1414654 RepID=A0A1J4QDI7_9GAMM|nr:acetylornithine deacetylase [Oceanisphaera psychrotolerans]OIN05542.1 acetylornithine deacetylase (ArgE) [Oceanisphaera psychrotolerans]
MASPLTLEILQQLIGFDTTSANSNLELMAYVQHYLAEHGVNSHLIHDEAGQKANLYSTIGPADKPGIMLSGHTDTVPVTGQKWSHDPYRLTLEQDRGYGRGTADMKGFLAVVLAAVPDMVKAPLHTPIHLAFSYDEEIGCIGVRRLIDNLAELPIKPALCIIGEPTEMKVVTAHKGKLAAKVTVTGKEYHSGMAPFGVNAINYAARLVCWLEQLAIWKRNQGPFEEGYDIPYTTVHTGTMQGGTALNIVPNHCEFMFEIRNVAAEDPHRLLSDFRDYAETLVAEMRRTAPDCSIDIELTTEYPCLSTANDSDVVAFVQRLAESDGCHTIGFGTEGGLFSNVLGVPTVVCGPGSMDQGHKPDEFIEISQLGLGERFVARLIEQLSPPHGENE